MTIDLRYLIPFAVPVALMQFMFFMFWMAGIPLDQDVRSFTVGMSLFFGLFAGGFWATVAISDNHMRGLVIRIGKEKSDD